MTADREPEGLSAERLAEIRALTFGNPPVVWLQPATVLDLLATIDDLTAERDNDAAIHRRTSSPAASGPERAVRDVRLLRPPRGATHARRSPGGDAMSDVIPASVVKAAFDAYAAWRGHPEVEWEDQEPSVRQGYAVVIAAALTALAAEEPAAPPEPEPCWTCSGTGSSSGSTHRPPGLIGWSPCQTCGGSGKAPAAGPPSAKSQAAVEAIIAETRERMAAAADPEALPDPQRSTVRDLCVEMHNMVFRMPDGELIEEFDGFIPQVQADYIAAMRTFAANHGIEVADPAAALPDPPLFDRQDIEDAISDALSHLSLGADDIARAANDVHATIPAAALPDPPVARPEWIELTKADVLDYPRSAVVKVNYWHNDQPCIRRRDGVTGISLPVLDDEWKPAAVPVAAPPAATEEP